MRCNKKKLGELIVYICSRSAKDPDFNIVKLNKLLFWSDVNAYLKNGESISGCEYVRLDRGPAPDGGKQILDALVDENRISIMAKHKPIATSEPDVTCFSAEEIAIVEGYLHACINLPARAVVAMAHGFDGWRLAKRYERIPYYAALKGDRDISWKVLDRIGKMAKIA